MMLNCKCEYKTYNTIAYHVSLFYSPYYQVSEYDLYLTTKKRNWVCICINNIDCYDYIMKNQNDT